VGSDPLMAGVAAKNSSLGSTGAHNWAQRAERPLAAIRRDQAESSNERMHFVSSNPEMLRIRKRTEKISQFDIPVLILGETGTGKEVLARQIHGLSPRAAEPFRKVNCAALPEALLESELFGYERGAFTGALRSKPGQFEMCDRGTIFLDEIAEMPAVLQAKLLHVLQDGSFTRLGGHEAINVDVRVIAATNVNIAEAIRSQRLREDLYYRLNAFTIQMPPLRSLCDEIPDMLEHFARQFASDYDCSVPTLSPELINACVEYPWPGNIREMRGFVQRLIIQKDEQQALRDLDVVAPAKQINDNGREECRESSGNNLKTAGHDLKALGRERKCAAEKAVIARILRETHYNRKATAQRLQISYKALFYKIHQYGLVWKAEVDEQDNCAA
jgi:two-component system response regulator AtoC